MFPLHILRASGIPVNVNVNPDLLLGRFPVGTKIPGYTTDLAHVVHAVVDVDAAVFSFEPRGAVTSVVSKVVPANTAVLTWLKLARAKVNLVLAELSGVPPSAGADVAVDAVNAGGVVLATVAFAIVHVHLAPKGQTGRHYSTESFSTMG